MRTLTILIWLGFGAVQLAAFREGIMLLVDIRWLELDWLVAACAFAALLSIPVPYAGPLAVTVVAFLGATLGWGWSWWHADTVLLPFAALSVLVMGVGGTLDGMLRRNPAPAEAAPVETEPASGTEIVNRLEREWRAKPVWSPSAAGPFGDAFEGMDNATYATRILRPLAEAGIASAQLRLARMYAAGDGVATDEAEELWWYRRGAEQGMAEAQYLLGTRIQRRAREATDNAEAVKWVRLAAEQGHTAAEHTYGRMLANGLGVALDKAAAANWFERAAKKGHPAAQVGLGLLLEKGEGVRQDLVQALAWLMAAAEQGHSDAATHRDNLIKKLEDDAQVEEAGVRARAMESEEKPVAALPSVQEAAPLDSAAAAFLRGDATTTLAALLPLAEKNLPNALFAMGLLHATGFGVERDRALAADYFARAAADGHVRARHRLALAHLRGEGVDKNPEEAARLFRLAAEEGYAASQRSLGAMYATGVGGCAKDPASAAVWYKLAAQQQHPAAQCNLGYCYAHGLGVRQDNQKAAEWYRRAADQGYPQGQASLGYMYVLGRGVTFDLAEGARWYMRAERGGDGGARLSLAALRALSRPRPVREGDDKTTAMEPEEGAESLAVRISGPVRA